MLNAKERLELQNNSRYFISLVKVSNEFIAMCNENFDPFFINESGLKMIGFNSLEEACSRSALDTFYPDDREKGKKFIEEKVKDENPESLEIRFQNVKTGEPIWVLWNVFALKNEAHKIIGWATVTQNIHRRKILEEAQKKLQQENHTLNASSQMIEQFLSSVSHEMRNHLNSVTLLSQNLYNNLAVKVSREEAKSLKIIKDAVNDLNLLIDDLLDVSRMEKGLMNLRWQEFSCELLISSIKNEFENIFKEKNIEFTVKFTEKTAHTKITTDLHRLKQIIKNLLSNAIKYGLKAPVEISFDIQRDILIIKVVDHGCGIIQSEYKNIFKKFYRTKRGMERNQGTGLGLHVVKKIISLLRGKITFVSEVNVGSTFTVEIPSLDTSFSEVFDDDQEKKFVTDIVLSPEQLQMLKGMTILIVDDEVRNLFSLSQVLREYGIKCIFADNSDKAITLLHKSSIKVDCVVTDIHMPNMDGFTFEKTIRSICKERSIRVFAVSGTTDARDENFKYADFGGFLIKPIKINELIELFLKK